MENKPRSFLELDSWKEWNERLRRSKGNSNNDNQSSFDIDVVIDNYSSKLKNSSSNISQKEDSYLSFDLSSDFINKVNSDSKQIAVNNRNLEQKIKAELAGINIFKKSGHYLKTIVSSKYRDQTADQLLNNQLQICTNFKDAIKTIYLKINDDLNKNVTNLDNLEKIYIEMRDGREETKKIIEKTKKDYLILENTLEKGDFPDGDKLKIAKNNSNRVYRKAISKLDELNNSIINNVQERDSYYISEIIFERYEAAFKKIYNIAESEIRKIDNLKGLYLDAMRGGKLVNQLERGFENVFASLRIMDNFLLKGINSIIESSSEKGRIRELRDEKNASAQRLLETIKGTYIPDAEYSNRLVENYVRGEK